MDSGLFTLFLDIMNNIEVKIHVQHLEWTQVLITLGYIPRVEYGIAGSYGNFNN